MAIDGNPTTAWGIYPRSASRTRRSSSSKSRSTLRRRHDADVRAGADPRPRPPDRPAPAVASRPPPRPVRAVDRCPTAIAAILAIPRRAQRTDAAARELARVTCCRSRSTAQLAALPPPQMVYAAASDFTPDGSFKPAKGAAAGPRPAARRHPPARSSRRRPGRCPASPGLDARFDAGRPERRRQPPRRAGATG